jgi:hypothetical protein
VQLMCGDCDCCGVIGGVLMGVTINDGEWWWWMMVSDNGWCWWWYLMVSDGKWYLMMRNDSESWVMKVMILNLVLSKKEGEYKRFDRWVGWATLSTVSLSES